MLFFSLNIFLVPWDEGWCPPVYICLLFFSTHGDASNYTYRSVINKFLLETKCEFSVSYPCLMKTYYDKSCSS